MRNTIELNGTEYVVNDKYEYEDQDVTAILNARVRQYNAMVDNTRLYPMAAIDTITPRQLTQRLDEDTINHPQGKRIILIPCNIGNYHWVGLLLEFNENNDCIRAEFMNSTHSVIPPTLQNQLQFFYQMNFTTYHNVIKQSDGTSCGACTIENLILRMLKSNPLEIVSMSQLRAKHLDILRIDSEDLNETENERAIRKRFFETFNQRQRLNQRTFNSTPFIPANSDTYKSESEMQAIIGIAKRILQSNETNFDKEIKEIFTAILENQKKHKIILNEIRCTLWQLSSIPNIQEISGVIFGIKEISGLGTIEEYHKNAVLQFDYCYLENIAEFVVHDNKISEFENKQKQRKEMLVNLRDPDDLIREKAAEYLRDLPESLKEDELNSLRNAARYDVYQTVRTAAAEALYIKGIKEDREESRKIVLALLVYPGFGNLHHEGADLVRERAAKALEILRDCGPEVMQALNYATEDPFQNVKEAATKALQQLEKLRATVNNAPFIPMQSLHSSAELRLDYLKKLIAEQAKALKSEFEKTAPDYNLIRNSFYLFSWRINELNWGYKYRLKDKNLVSEEAWHLFEFICRYLTSNPNIDCSKWNEIAGECQSLSNIINTETGTELKHPFLEKEIRPAFAKLHLEIIYWQMRTFFNASNTFDANDKLDCHALLGLLMIVGESAKRLDGINPKLPESVENELNTIKNIRDLLEKKLPGNLFNSPKLINKMYIHLRILKKVIEKYLKEQPAFISIQESDALKQLLVLLKEESSYKYPEQAKLFFASLEDHQSKLHQFLQEQNYASFLKERFDIDNGNFDSAISEVEKNQVQDLSREEKDKLVDLANQHLKGHKLLRTLLRLIRSPKTKPNGIQRFLSDKKINITEITDILNKKSVASDARITQLSGQCGLTKEDILQVKKLFDTLSEHNSSDDFDTILFTKIKELPWLLDLNTKQSQFLKVLNREEAIDNQESLDELLKNNRLNGDKINTLLNPKDLLYIRRSYYKKFSYPRPENDEIVRLIGMIDKLIKLLVDIKGKNASSSFTQLVTSNYKYQLALQIGIKAFGIIVKEKLGEAAKQQLLANKTGELTEKHIKLLELFRNELAHRAAEVDPYQLSWFALQWAIISYPTIKNQVSTKLIRPMNITTQARPELAISQSMLTEHAILIQDLIKAHGCTKARAFGCSLGCGLGIQAELNIIVESLPGTTQIDLYNLQWKIHFMLGYKLQVFTERSLRDSLSATTSETQIDEIIEQAIDLVSLQHLARIKEMVDSNNWYNLVFTDQQEPTSRKDIDPQNIDLKKVRTVILASQSNDFLRQKQYREKLLEQEAVKEVILEKVNVYVQNLLKLIKDIDKSVKPIFLERLEATMILNSELDQFYENHMDVILSHDLQISRFRFRHLMRSEHDKLPEKIKKSDLAKRVKKDWEKEACICKKLCEEYGRDNANVLNMIYFLLDEVRNPGIVKLLFNDNAYSQGSDSYLQFLNCVYINFCERFVDPTEKDAEVFFTEPPQLPQVTITRPNQKQATYRSSVDFRSGFLVGMDSFNKPVNLSNVQLDLSSLFKSPKPPTKHVYVRIPFYEEVLKEISASLLPTPIIDWGVEERIRNKILNIRHNYKPLPRDKEMTINKLFDIGNWQYDGKIQKLCCQAATFEYPPITDFDSLLEKEQINKENYPEYEKDRTQFNQFREVIGCLYNIYYYEKYIRNLEQHKSKIENASLTLTKDSQSYKVNKEYIQEIAAQIELLQNLQGQHIKQLIVCQYIKNHSFANDSNFNKELAREMVDWIYYDKKDSPSKNQLHKSILDCFNPTVVASLFFSSTEDLINNRHNSPDLQIEYDKQFGLTLTN